MSDDGSGPPKPSDLTRPEFHTIFRERARFVDWKGIPWRFALAQADVESGFGNGGVFKKTMNLFSITKGSWLGPIYTSSTGLDFRVYDSWEESMRDWVKLITGNARYRKALSAALNNDFKGFATEIKAAGYDATNPQYASLLESRFNALEV